MRKKINPASIKKAYRAVENQISLIYFNPPHDSIASMDKLWAMLKKLDRRSSPFYELPTGDLWDAWQELEQNMTQLIDEGEAYESEGKLRDASEEWIETMEDGIGNLETAYEYDYGQLLSGLKEAGVR
jgi:hypothetical protein